METRYKDIPRGLSQQAMQDRCCFPLMTIHQEPTVPTLDTGGHREVWQDDLRVFSLRNAKARKEGEHEQSHTYSISKFAQHRRKHHDHIFITYCRVSVNSVPLIVTCSSNVTAANKQLKADSTQPHQATNAYWNVYCNRILMGQLCTH
jgi:hypothetical protein